MNEHGGRRAGAGRKKGEPSRSIRIPESMVRAAQSLQKIARGQGTEVDLAEIGIAINKSSTDYNGVVCLDEMLAGVREMTREADAMPCGELREEKESQLYDLRERIRQATY